MAAGRASGAGIREEGRGEQAAGGEGREAIVIACRGRFNRRPEDGT